MTETCQENVLWAVKGSYRLPHLKSSPAKKKKLKASSGGYIRILSGLPHWTLPHESATPTVVDVTKRLYTGCIDFKKKMLRSIRSLTPSVEETPKSSTGGVGISNRIAQTGSKYKVDTFIEVY